MSYMDLLNPFLLTIIPLMVAIDAPGVLPFYLVMTEGIERHEKKRIARESVFTALLITLLFVCLGRAVFGILGILVEDFMIAGGILLMVISISDLLTAGNVRTAVSSTSGPASGIVPLGTPLLAGPATLTTCLLLVGNYGYFPVILSLIINLMLAWLLFDKADVIIRIIGVNGARGITRLASLLLAAIAVRMIRLGILKIVAGSQ